MDEMIQREEHENKNISLVPKKTGGNYTMRRNKLRYFFPEEWNQFFNTLKWPRHKLFFLTLINTGARVMEAIHIRPIDFNFERSSLKISVVKQKANKKKRKSLGSQGREFFVPTKYTKKIKSYILKEGIGDEEYIFLKNDKLPADYEFLKNSEKKKYYEVTKTSYSQLLKRKLEKSGVKDWEDFSLHNIRKTYGNWMRLFISDMGELCYRMGHDFDTFMEHYGSSLLFTNEDKRNIQQILGEVR